MEQRVLQLLTARTEAIVRGENNLAINITLELYYSYNVGVNDHTMTWSVGGQFLAASAKSVPNWQPPVRAIINDSKGSKLNSPKFPQTLLFGDKERVFNSKVQYRESVYSKALIDQRFLHRVNNLIQERLHKREEGKYLEADAIRIELWRTYNVGVNDRLQQYSVGGVYDDTDRAI